ncbi:EF hand domain containing protein [Balamuthia mandrillaris]
MGNKVSKAEVESLQEETKLSPKQIKQLEKAFAKVARNDKRVSKRDFKVVIGEVFKTQDSTLVQTIFNMFDSNQSGDIDFREFVLAIGFLNNTQLEDAVDLSFRCLDLNRDGTISKQEMRECIRLQWQIRKHLNLLSSSSQPVALGQVSLVWSDTPRINAEADELFAKLDADGDGSITKEEFMAAVQRDPQLKAKIESLLLKSQTEKIFQL